MKRAIAFLLAVAIIVLFVIVICIIVKSTHKKPKQ